MQVNSRLKKYLLVAVVVAVGSWLVAGWFWKTVAFEEEVLLGDNRKIVIKRWQHMKRACEGFSCGWALDSSEIELPSSIRQQTRNWKGPLLMPLVLDVDRNGAPFVVSAVIYSHDERVKGRDSPYLQFVAEAAEWREIPMPGELHGRRTNLLISPDDRNERARVTVEEKTKRNDSAQFFPYLKQISLRAGGSN